MNRAELIAQITANHPGDCPREWSKKGWAHYIGGMQDDGGWNYQMLYGYPESALEALLAAITAELRDREQRYQAMLEKYGGREPTFQEWIIDEWEEAILDAFYGGMPDQMDAGIPVPKRLPPDRQEEALRRAGCRRRAGSCGAEPDKEKV